DVDDPAPACGPQMRHGGLRRLHVAADIDLVGNGTYSKRLSPDKYAKENVILLVRHTDFVQTNPEKDIVRTGFSGTTEHHINVKKTFS
ncbi:MAG: hypothetical protein AAFZ92_09110, partial [Pseudomonadota bacterium]